MTLDVTSPRGRDDTLYVGWPSADLKISPPPQKEGSTPDHTFTTATKMSEDNPLIVACRDKNQAEALRLIQEGVDVNAVYSPKYSPDQTPASLAAGNGMKDVLVALIQRGADVNRAGKDGETALHAAVASKHEDCALLLIEQDGADVNTVDHSSYKKYTPAMYASENGLRDTLHALIDANADVKYKTKSGNTALYAAVESRHEDCAQLLIEHKADVNAVYSLGESRYTPTIEAASKGLQRTLIALIDANADVKYKTKSGKTALYAAVDSNHEACTQLLIEHKADVNAVYSLGDSRYTPTLEAASKGLQRTLTALIDAKADVNYVGERGQTALYAAVESSHEDCAQQLIQQGADVDAIVTTYGGTTYTPALYAAREGLRTPLAALIKANADVMYAGRDGETALHKALASGHGDCAQLLIQSGADVDIEKIQPMLVKSISRGNYGNMLALLDIAGVDVSACNEENVDALGAELLRPRYDDNAACVFTLLCMGSDAKREHEKIAVAVATYRESHGFIEEYHRQLNKALERDVVVDKRVGLGEDGLYQEPLEAVLEYCGLRMKADQVVNVSIDGADTKRLLILQHRARNAHHWFLQSPAGVSYTMVLAERKRRQERMEREKEEERLATLCESCNAPADKYDTMQSCSECYRLFCNGCRDFCQCCFKTLCKDSCGGNEVVWEKITHNGRECFSACQDCQWG
jgi:ankyrin repeat protein